MAGLALGKKIALATMGTFFGGGTGKTLVQLLLLLNFGRRRLIFPIFED